MHTTHRMSPARTKSMSDSAVKFRRKSSDFPRLLLRERETGCRVTVVSERVLGERRTGRTRTEVYRDEDTGEETTRTVELIEKMVEQEVNVHRGVEAVFLLHSTFAPFRHNLHKHFTRTYLTGIGFYTSVLIILVLCPNQCSH